MFDLNLIHQDVRREGAINRRHWLAWTAALSTTPILGRRVEGRTMRAVAFKSDPFALGVASGDPDACGFVAWTRLAPSPLEPGGGMPAEKVEEFGGNVPLGRPGQPVELAPVYVLLASDEASYVSGARVAVTGGRPIL